MTDLILLGTYWNEIDWIKPSLAQIERLDPKEVLLCDGCFDPDRPPHSTDGTREILEEFVSNRPDTHLVSPVRTSKAGALFRLWKGVKPFSSRRRWSPARALTCFRAALEHPYRLNQALTFQRMIKVSRQWAVGRWFMTYDADQFYTDDTLEAMAEEIGRDSGDVDLLTAEERTFFWGFEAYTLQYERRDWNNMPHRIFPNTYIKPTRDLVREGWYTSRYYRDVVSAKSVGRYHHYKFVDRPRFSKGYDLADREPPPVDEYERIPFEGTHPEVVATHFDSDDGMGVSATE